MRKLFTFSFIAWAQTRDFNPGLSEVVDGVPTLKGLEAVFSNVVSVVLGLSGVVLFIMLIVGGFKYLTAGGDPKALEAAKGTLSHAILGLVVLVLAFIILKVIAEVTGVSSILNFQITR